MASIGMSGMSARITVTTTPERVVMQKIVAGGDGAYLVVASAGRPTDIRKVPARLVDLIDPILERLDEVLALLATEPKDDPGDGAAPDAREGAVGAPDVAATMVAMTATGIVIGQEKTKRGKAKA